MCVLDILDTAGQEEYRAACTNKLSHLLERKELM
ncbi:hypothetical protein ACQP3L_37040 [Escherichia coli]